MEYKETKKNWDEYKRSELEKITPVLKELGFTLDVEQPHTIGERFLMQAVTTTSGKKLILLGTRNRDSLRVVIKVSKDKNGIQELVSEKEGRETLHKLKFAARTFFSPKEIFFAKNDGYLISIHEFIEQTSTFLERPLEEQFTFTLNSFKAQEGAHATTHKHRKLIQKTFSIFTAEEYLENFEKFLSGVEDENIKKVLISSQEELQKNKERIEQYCDFLVHTDFVPHNFRIQNKKLYLLDHSSIRFGNKYEGWARFLNFMTLYNRDLENLLITYIKDNRTREEYEALRLMRIYRLGEIISYYTGLLSQSDGELYSLNKERVQFWTHLLQAILEEKQLDKQIIENYKIKRDSLRSLEEKIRQKHLH